MYSQRVWQQFSALHLQFSCMNFNRRKPRNLSPVGRDHEAWQCMEHPEGKVHLQGEEVAQPPSPEELGLTASHATLPPLCTA